MRTLLLTVGFAASVVASANAQSGGNFELGSSTISGGGGVIAGGGFTLTGSIGQPDAGLLGGGIFTIAGGFWNIPVLRSLIASSLSLQLTAGSHANLTWPDDGTVWQLQSSTDLVAWTMVNPPAQLSDGRWRVAVPINPAQHFFRIVQLP